MNTGRIDTVSATFDDFKNYVSNEATLHPIVAVAVAILMPIAVIAVCVWGARKVYAASVEKDSKKEAIVKTWKETFVDKSNELYKAHPNVVKGVALTAIAASALYATHFAGSKFCAYMDVPQMADGIKKTIFSGVCYPFTSAVVAAAAAA